MICFIEFQWVLKSHEKYKTVKNIQALISPEIGHWSAKSPEKVLILRYGGSEKLFRLACLLQCNYDMISVSKYAADVLQFVFLVYSLTVEVVVQWTEMRMVRWMCGIKLQDRVPSKRLRERLGLVDIISVLQQNRYRLRWYRHVLQKEDNDWVKKYMEYEMEGTRLRGRPKKTWREIVEKDCQARNFSREGAMDHNRWTKLIRDD